jgi:uncharacterized OB-fold protein
MSSPTYDKPLPDTGGVNAPYWEGTKAAELRLQHCRQCGAYLHPAGRFCPGCLGTELEWTPAAGTGVIAGRIFMHQVYYRAFAQDVPYNVVWVELDEGPMMTANVVDAVKEDIEVGRRVQVAFDPVTSEITIPRFRLA